MSPLIPRYSSVIVLAPSGVTTGGPELLHQLVHEIRELGGEAAIYYLPDPAAATPDRYLEYKIAVRRSLKLNRSDCLVAPETMLKDIPLFTPAKKLIWWLSYDFFESQSASRHRRRLANYFRKARVQLLTQLGAGHLFQSYYACHRLSEQRIGGTMLSDYLSSGPPPSSAVSERRDVVLYNPKKGMEITERLIQLNPEIVFLPLVNMSKAEIESHMQTAKLYIDFGNHPGKDRLPREAAVNGAVVVVGKRGSAAFHGDVGLPDRYKLDVDDNLWAEFGHLVRTIFSEFETHHSAQNPLRQQIAEERTIFHQQVRTTFFKADGPVGAR